MSTISPLPKQIPLATPNTTPITLTLPQSGRDFLNPMRKYDSVFLPVDEWQPSEWQFYTSTHLYHGHYLGGFFNGGVHVDGLADNGDGTYTLSAGGLSTAKGKTPFEFGVHYSRKRVDNAVLYNIDVATYVPFVTLGPTLYISSPALEDQEGRKVDAGARVGIGVDWRRYRTWSIGAEVDIHAFATDLGKYPVYLTSMLRVNYHLDLF